MNNLKKKDGFTLVELIVVIAILAILAGVAIPAYSGYMDKAKEAADTQVLSVLNSSFGAACTEAGVAIGDVTATVTVTDNKVASIDVTAVDGVAAADEAAKCTEIEGNFGVYFATNTNTVLGYYTSFTQGGDGNFSGNK